MLMNMKSNSKVGKAITETASIAYTGELLPAGTASYSGIAIDATKRYLKNSGKDKTPALVESGQGKFFNGTNQYINTGATPNDSEGTFISRFTYASGAIQKIMAGMNYSNNRCYMGINASGKIGVGFGANTYDTLFSPDTLVAGRSYHVAFRYSGGTYWLFVDSVLKATGTITGLTTFAGTSFFIGALNNGGTPSNYFNSVIDETYYYDVALTDAQIESLYKYPEKVKDYNGAIVPDIGNEANCKLFLPMCESSTDSKFSFAINIADAQSNELVLNGNFDTDTTWNHSTNPTISGGTANWNGQASLSQPFTPIPEAYYLLSFTITSYTSGSVYGGFLGGVASFSNGFSAIGTYYAIIKGNVDTTQLYFGTAASTVLSIDNVSLKKITAYPIVNWSSSMVTSAKQLSYGMQCIGMKRDANGIVNGVLIGGMSFDGAVSVKYPVVASANVIPDTAPIVMEAIVYCEATGDYKFVMGSNLLRLGIDADGEPWCRIGSFQGRITPSPNTTTKGYYHHIAAQSNGTTLNAWVDGVQYRTNVAITVGGADGVNFVLGSSGWDKPYKRIAGTPKIHKGAEYAKFNIAKAWAKAQKTIAKLGA